MLASDAAWQCVTQARSQMGKKHYGRLTAKKVAYLNSIILVAVSRYYNF